MYSPKVTERAVDFLFNVFHHDMFSHLRFSKSILTTDKTCKGIIIIWCLSTIFKNLLLWNRLAKWTETWEEASMECPLWRLLISSRSVSKHGYHRNLVGSIYGMSSIKIAHFKMCTLQRGPSIDASYQLSVHLAEGFQRRRLKCKK
jgi:hypothetical protein